MICEDTLPVPWPRLAGETERQLGRDCCPEESAVREGGAHDVVLVSGAAAVAQVRKAEEPS